MRVATLVATLLTGTKKKGVKLTPLVKFFGFVCVVFPFYRGLIHDRIIIQR